MIESMHASNISLEDVFIRTTQAQKSEPEQVVA